jgi:hypothetical protein
MSIHGLIITIENYSESVGDVAPNIAGANSAGERFYRWLLDLKHVSADDVFVCSDGGSFVGATHLYPPKREHIVDAIVDLVNAGQDQTEELYVFFTGHGFSFQESPGKRTIEVIVASDFVSAAASGTKCIKLQEVQAKLWAILGGQHHYFFIDACRNVITEDDIELIDLGRKLGRTAQRGRPTRYSLFSTSFGQTAGINSKFAPTLLEGLYGKGKAKGYTPAHELYVMFPLLTTYVSGQMGNQKIDEVKEGSGDGYIIQIQPVPTYNCKVLVRNAKPNDQFVLKLAPFGQPQFAQTVQFKGAQAQVTYQPDNLALEVHHNDVPLPRVKPPVTESLSFFDDCFAEFEKPPVGSFPVGVKGLRGPISFPEVTVESPTGTQVFATNLDSGKSLQFNPGTKTALDQGRYAFSIRERGSTITRAISDIPHEGAIRLDAMQQPGPIRESIMQAVNGDPKRRTVAFSETLGELANQDLGLWLTIMGASRIVRDPTTFSKMQNLPLPTFSDMTPHSSRVYVMAASERYNEIAAAVGKRWRMLESVASLHRVFQSSFNTDPGPISISAHFGDAETRTYSSFCLPNRVTLVIFFEDEIGRLAVRQFFLPAFHLLDFMDPYVRNLLQVETFPLQAVSTMYAFQNQFARGRILDPPEQQDRLRWNEVLSGKWLDPVTSLIVCYDIIRRGDINLKNTVRNTVVRNLYQFFPGLPDTVAIEASLDRNARQSIPSDAPLFTEGLLVFPDWENQLPFAAKKLDYGSTWTTWVGAEARPQSNSSGAAATNTASAGA